MLLLLAENKGHQNHCSRGRAIRVRMVKHTAADRLTTAFMYKHVHVNGVATLYYTTTANNFVSFCVVISCQFSSRLTNNEMCAVCVYLLAVIVP